MNQTPAVSPLRILQYKRSRFNPIRQLSPATLARQLDDFERGDLREAAMLWDVIERRDDTLKCVIPKRKAAPARLSWEILTKEKSDEAERQKKVLEDFYGNLRCTSAVDRNKKGGVSLLIKQMMDAVGKYYSVHNIIWKPSHQGLRAEFQFVPLWFFENRTGELRYLKEENSIEGEDLQDGAWLIATGDGLMEASSIAYTFKRLPYQDWVTYSERHGMPGLLGKTNAQKDSPEWIAMEEALASISAEWAGVISAGDLIEALDLSAKGELPYEKLVERMDRALAALWRGADLSTMSAGSGEGTGASLQGDEADLLEMDDCANISEILNEQVDRWVLRLALGVETPLAYFNISRPKQDDIDEEIKIDEFLINHGAPIGMADAMERFGRAQPDEGEQLLKPRTTTMPPASNPLLEYGANERPTPPTDLLAAAVEVLSQTHSGLAGKLRAALEEEDELAFTQGLEEFLDDFDTLSETEPEAAEAWEKLISAAAFTGLTAEEEDAEEGS